MSSVLLIKFTKLTKGKAQQLYERGQVLETGICTGEQILDSLVHLTRVNLVHIEVEIKH